MTKLTHDKIAAGLNEAMAVADKSPPSSRDALREAAAMFAQSMIEEIASRRGECTVSEVSAIRDEVVQEIRAQFFAKDVTPKDSA